MCTTNVPSHWDGVDKERFEFGDRCLVCNRVVKGGGFRTLLDEEHFHTTGQCQFCQDEILNEWGFDDDEQGED